MTREVSNTPSMPYGRDSGGLTPRPASNRRCTPWWHHWVYGPLRKIGGSVIAPKVCERCGKLKVGFLP